MGGLHRIERIVDGRVESIRILGFPGFKPEGICVRGRDHFLIVFDQDNDIPSFCTVALQNL